MAKVLFINNDGGGFADNVDITEGMTMGQLFAQKMGAVHPGSYLIRINRAETSSAYVLQDGDRVSITPTKIEGACNDHSNRLKTSETGRMQSQVPNQANTGKTEAGDKPVDAKEYITAKAGEPQSA